MMRWWLKQGYEILALFALIHFVVLSGVVVYAYASGRVDGERLAGIAAVLRGEAPTVEQSSAVAGSTAGSTQPTTKTSEAKIKEILEAQDIARMKSERAMASLQQMEALINQRMLNLQLDIEKYEERVAREDEQRRKKQEQELSEGYLSTIQTIEGMRPKNARDMLMQLSDSDAVKILMTLDESARKDILESTKRPEEKTWRDRMLKKMLEQPLLTAGVSE